MSVFRYNTGGRWYKGNCHIHSTFSDGGKTPAELAQMYADAGYDFLCCTDHWRASNLRAEPGAHPLLWLDGIELHGADHTGAEYHVVCIGNFTGLDMQMGFSAALDEARSQGGLLILSHPHWTGNSLEDALRWRFDGVEVYNHVCRWLNGKSDGLVHWSAMLKRFPNTLAFAVDDAHVRAEHPGWNGGWIMANAPECTPEAIMAAVRAGNFYSTCGPEFHAIEYDGTSVTIATSPAQFVRLVGPRYLGVPGGSFEGRLFTSVTLPIPGDWPYACIEIEDNQGRRAWTNTLLAAETAGGAA